jgi:hypothetical protein
MKEPESSQLFFYSDIFFQIIQKTAVIDKIKLSMYSPTILPLVIS